MKTLSRFVAVLCCALLLSPPGFAETGLKDAVMGAVEQAGYEAKAADVVLDAGFVPGRYSREDVLDAFRAELGDERMAELSAHLEASRGGDIPTVAQLGIVSISGQKQAALGVVVVGLAALAFVVALAGCASVPAGYDQPRFSTYGRYGGWDLIGPVMSNRDCRDLAGSRGYRHFQLTAWGCWGS